MKKINRRQFGLGMGAAALLSPFLGRQRNAYAAGEGKAKYLLIMYSNGTIPGLWTPTGSTADNIQFSQMTAPLAAIKSDIVMIEKLSSLGTADNHAAPGGLTAYGYSGNKRVSIDQYVADGIIANGVATQIPSLILGGVESEQQTAFYRDNQTLSPIFSPLSAYKTICGDTGGGAEPIENILARRGSALDLVNSEIASLRGRLGKEQQRGLDLHTESIRQIEQRLTGGGTMAAECSGAAPGEPGQPLLASKTHLDLAVRAFAADITRVISVQFGNHQSTTVNLPEIEKPGDWHNEYIHGGNTTYLVQLENWLSQQFTNVIQQLKQTPAPDGNGTLFDQTFVMWARNMGDALLHNGNDMRFVFSGGANGYLNTTANGRYLLGNGEGHIRALLNCAEAMGVTNYDGFGDPGAPNRTTLTEIGG